MKALVTGASSGIGRDMARYLSELGYDLIIVARREERLKELQSELKTSVRIECADLSKEENVMALYEKIKEEDIDVLVNNAGFGTFGDFTQTDLKTEMDMIHTNITAMHILMKLVLIDMKKKDRGHILNVASIAAFMPGPLMATYYASKSYILRLTQSVHKELRKSGSHVRVSVLCPGPIATEFNDIAKVHFSVKPLSSEYVARYAINKMLKHKVVIIPGMVKAVRVLVKLVPSQLVAEITYRIQRRKKSKDF